MIFESVPICAMPPAHEQVLLRVAQEALHNALRHATASRIVVSLIPGKSPIAAHLVVTDDGRGFNKRDDKVRRGMGLASMRERAGSVGGKLSVHSEADKGTEIRLEVPCGRPG